MCILKPLSGGWDFSDGRVRSSANPLFPKKLWHWKILSKNHVSALVINQSQAISWEAFLCGKLLSAGKKSRSLWSSCLALLPALPLSAPVLPGRGCRWKPATCCCARGLTAFEEESGKSLSGTVRNISVLGGKRILMAHLTASLRLQHHLGHFLEQWTSQKCNQEILEMGSHGGLW